MYDHMPKCGDHEIFHCHFLVQNLFSFRLCMFDFFPLSFLKKASKTDRDDGPQCLNRPVPKNIFSVRICFTVFPRMILSLDYKNVSHRLFCIEVVHLAEKKNFFFIIPAKYVTIEGGNLGCKHQQGYHEVSFRISALTRHRDSTENQRS